MPESSPPLRADAARNVRRIVDAAHTVFSRGDVTVAMEEIAAEAGVGIATLYRRFPHREDLIRAVLQQRFDDMVAPALARAGREVDLRLAVRGALAAAVRCAAREQALLNAASDAGAMTMDLAQRFFEPVSELILRGQRAGVFRADLVPEDTPRLVLMLVGTLRSFAPGGQGWRRYLDLLMDALAPTSAFSELPAAAPVAVHSPRI